MADIDITSTPPRRKGAKARKSIVDLCGGKVSGYLTVIGEAERPNKYNNTFQRMAVCRCVCGNVVERFPVSLKTSVRSSCGCKPRIPKGINKTHGHASPGKISREYSSWRAMLDRCKNPHSKHKKNYSDRGIVVCERWQKFENFLEDMGERPIGKHTLDRIDVNGNYEPSNCRWASPKEQARNRRSTVWLTVNGNEMVVSDLAKSTGLSPYWVSNMIKSGMTGDEVVARSLEALELLIKP